MELKKKQIERQDFVDNAIFDLLKMLNPTNKQLDWDIEMISNIRDIVKTWIVEKTNCSEKDFYPYLEE